MKAFLKVMMVLILAVAAIAAYFRFVGKGDVENLVLDQEKKVHHFRDANILLQHIEITAVYFVPKDYYTIYTSEKDVRSDYYMTEWREKTGEILDRLSAFHAAQFGKYSKVAYTIKEEPVIGQKNSFDYITAPVNGEIPETLKKVAIELEERFPGMTLPDIEPGKYRVLLIVYENVGAVSSENVVLLGSAFLRDDPRTRGYGDTILYHEFAHTLGLEDKYAYDEELTQDFASDYDIMGKGRYQPLETTYIDVADKKAMGLY